MSNLSDFLGIPDFIPIELLVVGGGGGGGHGTSSNYYTAGGGAGQLIYGNINALTSITYNITVGTGGTGMVYFTSASGSEGQPSFFGSLKAYGGGRGGYYNSAAPTSTNEQFFAGSTGGTGGGPSSVGNTGIPFPRASCVEYLSFSNLGGSATTSSAFAGQGGGAGGAGSNNASYTVTPTNGLDLDITGTTETYAVGGRVGYNYNQLAPSIYGQGGGGGRVVSPTTDAQAGGGGVVIIAYPDTYPAPLAITGTYDDLTTRPGYRVYRWTAGTGTVKF